MKGLRVLTVLLTFSFLSICSTWAMAAQYATEGAVDPYEVTLFSNYDYSKPMASVRMAPGVRMLKIPKINGCPRSVLVGSKVAFILFPDVEYSSKLLIPSARDWFGHPSNYFLFPYFRFFNSTSIIDYHTPDFGPSSMIVHRKDINDMLGVYLHSQSWGQFLPLPENHQK